MASSLGAGVVDTSFHSSPSIKESVVLLVPRDENGTPLEGLAEEGRDTQETRTFQSTLLPRDQRAIKGTPAPYGGVAFPDLYHRLGRRELFSLGWRTMDMNRVRLCTERPYKPLLISSNSLSKLLGLRRAHKLRSREMQTRWTSIYSNACIVVSHTFDTLVLYR